jgi:hypothetical protein
MYLLTVNVIYMYVIIEQKLQFPFVLEWTEICIMYNVDIYQDTSTHDRNWLRLPKVYIRRNKIK